MPIIGSLPYNLVDGTTGSAAQVMANFNAIVSNVNSNANALGTLTAPAGTRKLFNNATAPIGWTIDSTVTDHGVWIASGSGGTKNSSKTAFSTFLDGGWTADSHTLSVSELSAHSHDITLPYGGVPGSGTYLLYPNGNSRFSLSFTSDAGTGGGGSHGHSQSTQWNYIACVVAQKS